MSRAGDVHNLPLEDRPNADLKRHRPWLLLHAPGTDTPRWAFAYGSTQVTETALGADPLSLSWKRTTGQREKTNFYPCRLRTPYCDDVAARIGFATGPSEQIGAAFRAALGIGEGVRWSGDPRELGRGRVVRLTQAVEADTDGARLAVIVTAHQYAVTRRYQHLVPIYDAAVVEAEPGEIETDGLWASALPGRMSRAVLAVPQLFTGSEDHRPFIPGHIAALTTVAVDAPTMAAIDEALVRLYRI